MNFLNGSFTVGRLFDITIRVHVLFLVYIGFRVYEALQSGGGWQYELAFMALLFGIVLMHEFGHCLAARSVGGDARDILMWPLGGLAYAHAPMRPWPQFVTVAGGPLVNVIFCLLAGGVLVVTTGTFEIISLNPFNSVPFRFRETWLTFVGIFYEVNYFLLAFNLLPVYPMDGGQLLQAIIWPLLGLRRATLLVCQIGLAGCVIFGLFALRGGGGGMLLFIALFGGMTCWQRLQAARQGLIMEDSPYEAYYGPSRDPRSWWQRIFRTRTRAARPAEPANPNPGGWAVKVAEIEDTDAELDRILRKVSEHGLQSLSYVERQRLERITRERQRADQEFDRQGRV